MCIKQRDTDGVLILDLEGKAVAGMAQLRLRRVIDAAIARGRSRILCNLERVTVMDAAGVGELAGGYVKAQAAGGELKLLDPPLVVMSLLILCGLGDKFSIVRSGRELASAFARSERATRARSTVTYGVFDSRAEGTLET